MAEANCLFCRLVAGDIPATIVRETERTVAFHDIDPQAPVHVLVIPRDHHADVAALAGADPGLLSEVVSEAVAVAADEGLVETGYRIVTNVGRDANQTVPHLHLHVLGGRRMAWPPG